MCFVDPVENEVDRLFLPRLFGGVRSDSWEAVGLQEVFGNCRPPVPVFAPKSSMGNLGAGSSTTELAMSLLALEHGQLPPTLNYEEPDPACPVTVAKECNRPVTRPCVLKVGFTDMGQCAAVVVRKPFYRKAG